MFQIVIVIYSLIILSKSEDSRSMLMSSMNDMNFECANSNCLISTNVPVRNFISCQYLCLMNKRCRTTTFDRTIKQCQLYNDIPNGNNYLLSQMDITTTVVYKDTQSFDEETTWLSTTMMLKEDTSIISQSWISSTSIQSTLMTTSINCLNTKIFPSGRSPTIGWYFENNLIDYFGQHNGSTLNNITYDLGRNGCGKCLNLKYSLQEFVQSNSTPYIDLRNNSFSIESWIKPFVVGDGYEHVILGQCPMKATDQCMRASISGTGHLSFLMYADTLTGSLPIPVNSWSHMVYVYNFTARTMSLYLNGSLDISGGTHGPFQGRPSTLEIGNVVLYNSANISFNGCIDDLWFYPFARTAQEISTTFALN